jgi:hypothetical protein
MRNLRYFGRPSVCVAVDRPAKSRKFVDVTAKPKLENFSPLHRQSLLRLAEILTFPEMADDEIGSRTHAEQHPEKTTNLPALPKTREGRYSAPVSFAPKHCSLHRRGLGLCEMTHSQ